MTDTPARQIDKLDHYETIHAKCKQPEFSFRDLISIYIGQCQSSTMDAINLGVDVSFEAKEISIDGLPCDLSIAEATIRLEHENAIVHGESRYRHVLKAGRVEASHSTRHTNSSGGEIGIDSALGVATAPKVGIVGNLFGKKGKESEALYRAEPEIVLVQPGGQDSWKLGGPDGNPLTETRDLRGPIISSFLDDAMKPLCRFSAKDEAKPVSGKIRVQASVTNFRLRAKRQPFSRESTTDSIRDGLADDRKPYLKRVHEAEATLKERVAGLVLLSPNRPGADSPVFDLAERGFAFVPVSNDPVENAQ
jgi:hypothetical protein